MFKPFISEAAMLVMLGVSLDDTVAEIRRRSWAGAVTSVHLSFLDGCGQRVAAVWCDICLPALAAVTLVSGAVATGVTVCPRVQFGRSELLQFFIFSWSSAVPDFGA